MVIVLLVVLGLIGGKPFVGPNVLLTWIVPSDNRGTALGIQNSFMFFAAATGPLFTGYVADLWGFNAFFTVILCLYILAALTLLPIVRDYWREHTPHQVNLSFSEKSLPNHSRNNAQEHPK